MQNVEELLLNRIELLGALNALHIAGIISVWQELPENNGVMIVTHFNVRCRYTFKEAALFVMGLKQGFLLGMEVAHQQASADADSRRKQVGRQLPRSTFEPVDPSNT